MKTINYTGSSKLISRIVHLLNRKAPLPLDGDGDADWGTSGQVLTTDGQGNTSWTTPQGGGGDVTDVEVNGTSVVNAQGVAEVTVPTNTSDLNNDSGFITNLVNDLANYYTKSQTYTQAEVDALISGIVTLNILVVQVLPTQDISTTTIYLVPKQDAGTSDIYDEYLYINNAWELIGTTQIDLSNYVTTTDLSTALADYVTSTGLTTILANYALTSSVPTKTSDLTNDSHFVADNPTFTEASTRANIASGDSFSTILGKIKKFFTDLKTVAFTGAYGDLSGTPNLTNVAYKNTYNTFSATQYIDRQDGTTSSVGTSGLKLGNNIPQGTDKNSYGYVDLFGKGSAYGRLQANNVTANRILEFPDKAGTLALTSDLDSRVDWVSNGIIGTKNAFAITLDILKKSNTSGTWNNNAYTLNNVVFTVNLDTNGNVTSITANGLASGDASLTIGLFGIANGDYILSGCPAGGNESSTYFVALGDGINRIATDIGSGRSFSVTTNAISGLIRIKSGYNAQSLNFYPMIRLSADTDATFQPYAMTNLELTNRIPNVIDYTSKVTSSDTNINLYNHPSCIRYGNVVTYSVAIRYSTAPTGWTNITDFVFPAPFARCFASVVPEAADVKSLSVMLHETSHTLQALGGVANQVYFVALTYICQ